MSMFVVSAQKLFHNKFVYVLLILCFDIDLCFVFNLLLEYEMYAPRAHLRKGALRPHFYYNYIYIYIW